MIRDFGAVSATSGTDANKVEGVLCNVTNCYYNKNNSTCTAGNIKVGPQNAACTDDTVCATFRQK